MARIDEDPTVACRFEEMEARLDEQRVRIQRLELEATHDTASTASAAPGNRKGSRRDLLKMTGTAVAGAAGAVVLNSQAALATQGQPVIAGQNNTATAATSLDADSGNGADRDGLTARGSGQYSGLVGYGGNSGRGPGLVGFGGTNAGGDGGPGIKGIAGGNGNPGPGDYRTGVFGYGVFGVEATGTCLRADGKRCQLWDIRLRDGTRLSRHHRIGWSWRAGG